MIRTRHAQSATEISKKLDALVSHLEVEQLARQQSLIVRERKVKARSFLQLCVLSENITATSLEEQTAVLLQEDICLSKQALNERFSAKAVKFLEQVICHLLQGQLQSNLLTVPEQGLTSITIADSTRIMLPESMQSLFAGYGRKGNWAGLKIFFEYDHKQGFIKHLTLHPASENDYQAGEKSLADLQKKELLIRDLGFYKLDCFARIVEREAYFLSRYKTGTNLYARIDDHHPINLLAFVKAIPEGQSRQLTVYAGSEERVQCRLIVDKFDNAAAACRRRKLRQKKRSLGETVSKQRLELCSCNCYITNLPQEQFTLDHIQKIYSIRWQIELLFKAWKSTFNIDKIKPVNPYRILCFIYGKLIAILLCSTLFWTARNRLRSEGIHLSELKSLKRICSYQHELIAALIAKRSTNPIVFFLVRLLYLKAQKERKKGKQSALDCLPRGLT
jgi:hypothetical protein